MAQVNRMIDDPDLDDVDHALGRPYRVYDAHRNYYATDCPEMIAKMDCSLWWERLSTSPEMTYFRVTPAGVRALEDELLNHEKYGRLYEVSRGCVAGCAYVVAKSRSAARYAAYIEADVDWSFMEFCEGLRVRIAQ